MHASLPIGVDRRDFLRTAVALSAGVAVRPAWASALPSTPALARVARSCILVHLAGGVAQTDTWDPKEHTPLRRGMPLRSLGSTCGSIPTAAPGVRLAEGLEEIASVMDRGCVVRTIVGPRGAAAHASAPDLGQAMLGQSPSGPQGAGMTALPWGAMSEAVRLVSDGPCWCRVECPFEPFGGFDTHDHGGRRMMALRRKIDRPIADLVRGLEARGLLDDTLVVVTSEFGRTVGPARHEAWHPTAATEHGATDGSMDAWLARATIDDESTYGFHAHFTECSAALLFGGGVRRGIAWGRTADTHPMIAVENPVPWASWCATIGALLGQAPRAGWGEVVGGVMATGLPPGRSAAVGGVRGR